jgi:hypothetical protein
MAEGSQLSGLLAGDARAVEQTVRSRAWLERREAY